MNFFRKTTPAILSFFRRFASGKIPPITPRPQSIPKALIFSRSNQTFTHFASSHSATPFQFLGRRSYYVDRDQVVHFRRRGFRPRGSVSPTTLVVVGVVGTVMVVTIYYGNRETVPYTKRTHVILLSSDIERQLGEAQFKSLKEQLKGKILPPIHPYSVRVQIISKQIIEGLQRGLQHNERIWSDMEYSHEAPTSVVAEDPRDAQEISWGFSNEGNKKTGDVNWSGKDEVLDDKWVEQSRKKALKQSGTVAPTTHHLEGLNWEVIVVRDPMVNAMCMPGGKIIVFTGLLDHFRTDAEIATVISHEVGHAVARHVAEGITRNLWLILLELILVQFIMMPDLINAMSNILLKFPFSRRMEIEADYIGLLLMASAGYDPRVAPKVYEKLGQITGDSALSNYLSTHPSSKKRSELLSQAHVMEEALNIYREGLAGYGVQGFL